MMPDNIDIILDDLCKGAAILCTQAQSEKHRNFVESISLGHLETIPGGHQYTIDYYGWNVQDAVAHIYNHLQSIVKNGHADMLANEGHRFVLVVFCPEYLDIESIIQKVSEQFNIVPNRRLTCYMFEAYIPFSHI